MRFSLIFQCIMGYGSQFLLTFLGNFRDAGKRQMAAFEAGRTPAPKVFRPSQPGRSQSLGGFAIIIWISDAQESEESE
jgi:hypothetical protein